MASTWLETLNGGEGTGIAFELFHENSKMERRRAPLGPATSSGRSSPLSPDAFAGYPVTPFSDIGDVDKPPAPQRPMKPHMLSRDALATMLSRATGRGRGADFLESTDIYLHAATVRDIPPGLYHYDRARNAGSLLLRGDQSSRVAATLLRPASIRDSAIQVFIASIFTHTVRRHGERGYRHALTEAGRLGERLAGAVASLGLVAVEAFDFYDRDADRLLSLDGVTAGTLAIVAIGAPADATL